MSVFDLGRTYTNLIVLSKEQVDELDPTLYVDRLCCQLGIGNTKLGRDIRAIAIRIIEVAKLESIVTGRRPYAISGAAVHLSAIANNLQEQCKDVDASVKHIAALLRIAEGTVVARIRELKEALLAKAQILPWSSKITLKNVLNNLPAILTAVEAQLKMEQLDSRVTPWVVDGASNPTRSLPPSFRVSQAIRDRRRVKLEKAKERLNATLSGKQPDLKNLDSEDLVIENLLMGGVPEECIIDGNAHSMLVAPHM